MKRAIPEHWVNALFAKMEAIYGGRFHDMWRGIEDFALVKATWREGLGDLSDDALRRGVAAMFHERRVPDLPRFRELCAAQPAMYRADPALTDETQRTPSTEAREHLARIKAMAKGIFDKQHRDGGQIRWAFRLIERAEAGEAITAFQIAFAEEAIRNWRASHHIVDDRQGNEEPVALPRAVPSPHIYDVSREPGSDDDLEMRKAHPEHLLDFEEMFDSLPGGNGADDGDAK